MTMTNKNLLAVAGVSGAVTFVILSGITLALLINWGSGQCISIDVLQRKLTKGMKPEAVEFALAIKSGALTKNLGGRNELGRSSAYLAQAGIGSLFVPQMDIVLVFDANGDLDQCYAELKYQLEELDLPVNIGTG